MPKKTLNSNTGVLLPVSYIVLFLVSSAIISLANFYFPHALVLGTFTISPLWALFHGVGTLTLLNTFIIPFVHEYENFSEKMLESKGWMLLYFIVNALGLWFITRFAEQFGIGASSWKVIVVVALLLDMAQGMAMMALQKKAN